MAETEELETTREDESIAEVTEKWKRALADYQNLLKRTEEEKQQLALVVKALVLAELLPVADSLEKAAESEEEGYTHIYNQLLTLFSNLGVTSIGKVGEEFDPTLHEAVDTSVGKEENRVTEVVQTGYRLNNKILRPAQVVVAKRSTKEEE